MEREYTYEPLESNFFWVYPGAKKVVFNRSFVLSVIYFAFSSSSSEKSENLAMSYDQLKEVVGDFSAFVRADERLCTSLRFFIDELVAARISFEDDQIIPADPMQRRAVISLNVDVFLECCEIVGVQHTLRKPPTQIRFRNRAARSGGWWSKSIRVA